MRPLLIGILVAGGVYALSAEPVDDGHADLGDGEIEQRGAGDVVDGEVVPESVGGDERPDETAPREAPDDAGGPRPPGDPARLHRDHGDACD